MWAYTAIMCLAVGVAYVLSRRTQRGLGLAPAERLGVGLGAFCGAMIGAKLPFVFSDWQAFLSGAAWFSDGKTILLGMAGGYLGVEAAKWSLGVRTRTGDSFALRGCCDRDWPHWMFCGRVLLWHADESAVGCGVSAG